MKILILHYITKYIYSKESCDTEDWSNAEEISFAITGIN